MSHNPHFNANANSFVPNASAPAFVPGGARRPQQQGGAPQAGGYPYGGGAPGSGQFFNPYPQQPQAGYPYGGQGGYGAQQGAYGGYPYGGAQQQQQQGGYVPPHLRAQQWQQQQQQPAQQTTSTLPTPPQAPVGVPGQPGFAARTPRRVLDTGPPIGPPGSTPSASEGEKKADWDDEDAAPAAPPAAEVEKPKEQKVLSLGSLGSALPKVDSPARTASPSRSAANSGTASPNPASSSAPAAKKTAATAAAATDKAPAAKKVEKKAEEKDAQTKEKRNADSVAKDVGEAATKEEQADLYGENAVIDPNAKTHLNLVFIGHVDAGKSTMGGSILNLTGMIDKRTLEKYEREAREAGRESWYLSWALDSTAQERAKGKTVEVGRAYFETDTRRYTILDAPGHKSFVPSMIQGASQADIAVLVISARKGEFETGFEKGGQTREHAILVKTAGVSKLVVVVNKMDDSTVAWSKERYDEITDKLTPFLRATGYNPKTDVFYIPVSGFTGANMKERVDKSVCDWYDGPALLEFLDESPVLDRKVNAPFMMPITEKYKDMGTVVVGKIESGRTSKGHTILMMPNKVTVEVTAIYNELEEEVNDAYSGDNIRLRLRGIDDEDIMVGFVLTDPRRPIRAVSKFDCELAILEAKNIITAGYMAVMHVHTAAEEVKLAQILRLFDKKTGKKLKAVPNFAKKGQKIKALLECAAPVCVAEFEKYPQLGRFTLRDEGRTVAIGKVTKMYLDEETTIKEEQNDAEDAAAAAATTASAA